MISVSVKSRVQDFYKDGEKKTHLVYVDALLCEESRHRWFASLMNKRCSNACLQRPTPHHDDGQPSLTCHQTVMREAYAKTVARGVGQLQGFVSIHLSSTIHIVERFL